MKKYTGTIIISLVVAYISNRLTHLFLTNSFMNDNDWLSSLSFTLENGLGEILKSPFFISLNQSCLVASLIAAFMVWFIYLYKITNQKNLMPGQEYGSASWGLPIDIKPFIDKKKIQNMILTETESMSIDTRKTLRNNNTLIVGGSGSGKTRFYLKPNLMQLHSSYVVTDPKGTVLLECGQMLENADYEIKVFNTINFDKSMHYNPFAYIKNEKDILKLVNTIILNTTGEEKGREDFWVKAERLLYQALIGYIFYELPENEHHFESLIDLIDAM